MEVKTKAIIAMTPGEDLSEKEGFFTKLSAGNPILVTAATDKPFGVVLDGEDTTGQASIAVCGGNAGTAQVKLNGAVSAGDYLQLEATGDVIKDSGAGARVIVAIALEDGVDDELIEAILLTPVTYS